LIARRLNKARRERTGRESLAMGDRLRDRRVSIIMQLEIEMVDRGFTLNSDKSNTQNPFCKVVP